MSASAAPPLCQLVWTRRDGSTREWLLTSRTIWIGSGAGDDVVLDDVSVSEGHCCLTLAGEGGRHVLEDSEAPGGTYVLGRNAYGPRWTQVTKAAITTGTQLLVGQAQLQVRFLRQPPETSTPRRSRYGDLVGQAPRMQALYATLERLAPTRLPMLLVGETGTGKELAARTVHETSSRASGPFRVYDCAGAPTNLIEADLFGHARGAFTHASRARDGLFVAASGGTLFLDELDVLDTTLQAKLLRAIEHQEVRPVGASAPVSVNVRVVAAARGERLSARLRADLYHRLGSVQITLPPLRERLGDLPLLIQHFLDGERFNMDADGQRRVHHIDDGALALLREHDWPGNVRELRNVLEQACLRAAGRTLYPEDLPAAFTGAARRPRTHADDTTEKRRAIPMQPHGAFRTRTVADYEQLYVEALVARFQADVDGACEHAGLTPGELDELLRRHGYAVGFVRLGGPRGDH